MNEKTENEKISKWLHSSYETISVALIKIHENDDTINIMA